MTCAHEDEGQDIEDTRGDVISNRCCMHGCHSKGTTYVVTRPVHDIPKSDGNRQRSRTES